MDDPAENWRVLYGTVWVLLGTVKPHGRHLGDPGHPGKYNGIRLVREVHVAESKQMRGNSIKAVRETAGHTRTLTQPAGKGSLIVGFRVVFDQHADRKEAKHEQE